MDNATILCVDDEQNILNVLKVILEKSGYTVFTARNGRDALNICTSEHVDIAIVDYKMPGMSGIDFLKLLKESREEIEVLILTGHGTIPNAVDAIKLGAYDYILKPFHRDEILNRIKKLLDIKNLRKENVLLKSCLREQYRVENFIGKTPEIVKIIKTIPSIANSESTVLILGETGTGKEEIAKAIHFSGKRCDKMFNAVDCASINPNLIESELFGHIKGAFTGAIHDKEGLLKATREGTLFLDEIAEIPVFIQVKLLRAIEERVVRPVGSVQSVKFDARIIAATSRNLLEAIEKREFREDLFYRLNVVSIKIPPLRERKDDIPLLVQHFIKKFDNKRKHITRISDSALQRLSRYDWPGNVRELANCIERAFTLGGQGEIGLKDLPDSIVSGSRTTTHRRDKKASTLSEHEKDVIIQTLEDVQGNKRKAAKILNVGVTTLYRKLKRYNIE